VFNKDSLGITLQQMGMVGAVSSFIIMLFQFPSGWLVDKFHPLRMTLYMQLIITPLQFVMYFFMLGFKTYVAFEGFKLVIFSLYGAAGLPLLITIFPKDKYGQYASCNGMIKSFAAMPAAFVGALFMDWMTGYGQNKDAYRWMFIWSGIFQGLSTVVLLAIYFMWMRYGGDRNYVPPGSSLERLGKATPEPAAEPAFPVVSTEDADAQA
jgi:maltose/moltooligosaccharide transporter